MLILDVDNYEGTLECLKNLYPFVTKVGIIVFDEYALETYGESDAVDEFLKNKKLKIKSIPWASTPTAYTIKDRYANKIKNLKLQNIVTLNIL